MAQAVRDFKDIPHLFVVEGESDVTGQRKSTPEKLDKIIQFLWDYQQKHNGESPNQTVIGRHVGINENGIGYWLSLLIDDGRLSKISGRPFRATITEHPKNTKAIDRFKRLLVYKEEMEAKERERIREKQAQEADADQRNNDKNALFENTSPPPADRETTLVPQLVAVRERPVVQEADNTKDRLDRFVDAHAQVRAIDRDVRELMPKLLKVASERDMVYELVLRGYTVTKGR